MPKGHKFLENTMAKALVLPKPQGLSIQQPGPTASGGHGGLGVAKASSERRSQKVR
jgi:hypothetical protein